MSLREQIAMTIATRDPLEDWDGKPINWADISEGHRECYRRDADAILAIPGIAVVELPEPDGMEGDDPYWGDSWWIRYLKSDGIEFEGHSMGLGDVKALAAALLAAAEYAERDQ